MQVVNMTVEFEGAVRGVVVPSQSRKGVKHTVLLACTCEGFQYAGHCYHLAKAAAIMSDDNRAAATRTRIRLREGAVQ